MNPIDDLFDKGIVALRETRATLIGSIGKLVTLLTLTAVAIVIFTEVSFVRMGTEAFTCELIALLCGAGVSYFAMENQGERLGLESEDSIAALRSLSQSIERIHGTDIEPFSVFCTRYAEEEARRRRTRYLIQNGLSEEALLAYQRGEPYNKKAVRVLRTAERIHPFVLTPASLLSTGVGTVGEELSNPEAKKRGYLLLRLLPSVLCMTLTVSIAIHIKGELSPALIASGILKLITLIGICTKGYLQGYVYARERLIPWIRTKTRLIEAYLSTKVE